MSLALASAASHKRRAREAAVEVDMQAAMECEQTINRYDEFAVAAVKKIEMGVFRGGLGLEMSEFGRNVELDEQHTLAVTKAWTPSAKKLFRQALLAAGFAVCRIDPHPTRPQEKVLTVIPFAKYKLHFSSSSQTTRVYYVEFLDADYDMMSLDEVRYGPSARSKVYGAGDATDPLRVMSMVQRNDNNVGFPLPDGSISHLIFIGCEPDEDGALTSPISVLLPSLKDRRGFVRDGRYSSYWGARPLHVVEIDKNYFAGAGGAGGGGGTSGRETFGVGTFAEHDMGIERQDMRYQMNLQERMDFKLALQAAAQGQTLTAQNRAMLQQAMFSMDRAHRHDDTDEELSQISPSEHHLVLGANQHMVTGPQPQGSSQFQPVVDHILRMAYAMLGIMPQNFDPQGTKYASDPQMTMQEWDQAVQNYQAQLRDMLDEAYKVAYASDIQGRANDFYKLWKAEGKKLDAQSLLEQAGATPEEEDFGGSPGQTKKNSGSGGGGGGGGKSSHSKLPLDSLLEKAGSADAARALRKERRAGMKRAVVDRTLVSWTFNHTPSTTFQSLSELYLQDLIARDTFGKYAVRMHGLPLSDLLTEEQANAQREKKAQEQGEALETELKIRQKYEPEKPGAGVKGTLGGSPSTVGSSSKSGGGGSSSSSSSKKRSSS